MDSFSNEAGKGCIIFVVLVIALCISIAICDYHHKKNNNIIETDVELQKHNDSLKIEVDNLDSIKVAIDALRKANIKLIELSYEKDINKNLRQIIVNDSVLAEQARQRYILLDRSCKKIKKQRNIAYCSSGVAIILLILSLLK